MTEYIRFVFLGTIFHPNSFRLTLFRAFSHAWFTQNKFLTELNLPISAVHFSFATIFQYLNFFPFRSYSKLRLSYGCSFQWCKTVCRYLLSSLRNKEANIGEHLYKQLHFEQRESKYANTWGGGGRARG